MNAAAAQTSATSARQVSPAGWFYEGDATLLLRPCVAVIGSRAASPAGLLRARRLARELIRGGAVVVSGLAEGIDAAAHGAALGCGGRTVGVIGTPLERAYPARHRLLQRHIAAHHLVVSPFPAGSKVTGANFPVRNRLMAALCQATVIVEASDKSGTLHQARECVRLGRPLFVCANQVNDPALHWPARFADHAKVLTSTEQVLACLSKRAA